MAAVAVDEAEKKEFVIGSRESQLAMWQAVHAQTILQDQFSSEQFTILGITTLGDKNQNLPLSKFSDKGVFTKELDSALLNGSIDCAVHCVKDLTTVLPKGLTIGCYLPRGTVNDCVIIDKQRYPNCATLSQLRNGSRIGTSSLRRGALIRRHYPSLTIDDIRGNLNTRLSKLIERHLFDAIILAHIGVERLGWLDSAEYHSKITVAMLDTRTVPYAVGQGALAILCRSDDSQFLRFCATLNHTQTEIVCAAERTLLRVLEGGCKVPVAVRCSILKRCLDCNLWNAMGETQCHACFMKLALESEYKLALYGTVLSTDGTQKVDSYRECNIDLSDENKTETLTKSEQLGMAVATHLCEQGAADIISRIKKEALASKSQS